MHLQPPAPGQGHAAQPLSSLGEGVTRVIRVNLVVKVGDTLAIPCPWIGVTRVKVVTKVC